MMFDRLNQLFLARKFKDAEALRAIAERYAREDDHEMAYGLLSEAAEIESEEEAFKIEMANQK